MYIEMQILHIMVSPPVAESLQRNFAKDFIKEIHRKMPT